MPDDRTTQGGNYWTLFIPGIWKLLHAVLQPIVVTSLGVKLCRPSEAVLDILPNPQRAAFSKEDGERVVDAQGQRIA
jgi:hypothetical protein